MKIKIIQAHPKKRKKKPVKLAWRRKESYLKNPRALMHEPPEKFLRRVEELLNAERG